ncbi:hypothetical protein ACB098_01G216100 [Castanea mollissima]
MDGSLGSIRLLFLGLLIIASIHPNFFCSGDYEVHCIESERHALLKFKQHLKDPLNRLASWAGDGDCCQWAGVVCHNVELHLRSFPPSRDFLTDEGQHNVQYDAYVQSMFGGKINPSLLDLKHLNYLDLSNNDFNGTQIPKFLGSMGSLRYLNLSNARFEGVIPHQLGNLSYLYYLDLQGYGLYANNLQWLSSLPSLQHLDMSHVNLRKASDWLQVTSKLMSLLELRLSDCELRFIPSTTNGNFSFLVSLDLSGNFFENTFIPLWIFSLPNLVSFDLSDNGFQGPIPDDLQNMTSLKHLYLSGNHFNHPIPIWLYSFSHLKFLDLHSNNLQGTISSAIENLTFAISIDFSYNELGGKLPRSLGNLCNLREIKLSSNKWSQEISEILESLSGCLSEKLEILELTDAQLLGHLIGPKFPQWLCSQSYLRHLDISNTDVLDVVPLSFWDSSSQFEYLNLANNLFHGEISNCPMILSTSVIDLSSNHFNGPLPCISSDVILLDLSNNSFSGSISHLLCFKVNESKQLGFLNLEKNHLLGKILDCWKKWKKLEFLNLGNNNFTSSIPASIGSLTLLKSLRLHNNKLSGKLQSSLKNCEKLENIDVAENDFFGSIPSWLGNKCSSLMILILRSNNFHGHIPEEFCALTSLQILDLSHNKLSGSMPTCVKNFSAMATKNNSNHDLSFSFTSSYDAILPCESALLVIKGRVFEYSTILQQVKSIDISSNCLSGEIPKEVTNLQGLQSLNLSYNLLIGRIPENIGNMGSLESIDFSVNLLSGQIPSSISSLTFLSHLNLSNNNLIGKIPLSTQLQSFNASSFNGNKLCGPPLADNCTISGEQPNNGYIGAKDRGGLVVDWFYVSPLLGFVVGLWVVCGPLLYNKQWRMMYFQFLDQMWYKLKDVVSLR